MKETVGGRGGSQGLCPALLWPCLPPWPVRGQAARGETGAAERGGGWGHARPAPHKAALWWRVGTAPGTAPAPAPSSVCTGTGALGAQRAARGRAPSAILLIPLATSGHAGPQSRGKGGLMGSVFLWVVPERKNLHPLHRHLLPALSFAAQTGLFQSLCFPALGNNNLWPLFFFQD